MKRKSRKNEIITLSGRSNSGKSETMKLLHNLIINEDSKVEIIDDDYTLNKPEFTSIFKLNQITVGITSFGKSYEDLSPILDKFTTHKCNLIVCCTRKYDTTRINGKKTGTNTAVNELKKYDRTVVKKHYPNKDGNRFEMNTYDAEQLFVRVSQFILLNS